MLRAWTLDGPIQSGDALDATGLPGQVTREHMLGRNTTHVHVVPLLIGKDPARIEDMWQYLYRGVYWRRGAVTMTAIAAVDTALAPPLKT